MKKVDFQTDQTIKINFNFWEITIEEDKIIFFLQDIGTVIFNANQKQRSFIDSKAEYVSLIEEKKHSLYYVFSSQNVSIKIEIKQSISILVEESFEQESLMKTAQWIKLKVDDTTLEYTNSKM